MSLKEESTIHLVHVDLIVVCLMTFSMVAGFLDAIAKVRQFKFHNDDDLYDRLSRRFSVVLLMLFTVVVSTKQYVGDPIACFAPAQVTGKLKKKNLFTSLDSLSVSYSSTR